MGASRWIGARICRLSYGDWSMALTIRGCGRKTNCNLFTKRCGRQRYTVIPPSWEPLEGTLCGKEYSQASSGLPQTAKRSDAFLCHERDGRLRLIVGRRRSNHFHASQATRLASCAGFFEVRADACSAMWFAFMHVETAFCLPKRLSEGWRA